jgi:DNA-directed RNA polymerase I subunit RPA1
MWIFFKIHLVRDLYTELSKTDEGLLAKISFREKFKELVDKIIDSEKNSSGGGGDNCLKNVVKEKIDIIKEFCDVKLKKNKQICPNCGYPLRQLRSELNAKLFYAKGASKRQMRKSETKRSLKKVCVVLEDDLEPIDLDDEKPEANEEAIDELDEKTKDLNINGNGNFGVESRTLDSLSGQTYITPIEAKKFLTRLIENEKEIIELMYGITSDINKDRDILSLFFFDHISVPPSKFRPISQFKEQKFENAQTIQLSKTIRENMVLKDILEELIVAEKNEKSLSVIEGKTKTIQERLQISWLNLQTIVNCLYDSELDKINKDVPNGLKQLLEKKEGLFRKHMMGKRVNYAGRSVISPDLYIGTDEIGIPEYFAKKLTYPQPVNSINFWEMRQLVLNGPDIYPGASFVQYGNGTEVRLKGKDYESRLAIAKQLLKPE